MSFPKLNRGDFSLKYDLGEELGSGAFSVVYECRNKKTGEICAVKMVDKEMTNDEQMLDEITIMSQLDHSNIIKFHEIFDLEEDYYVVLEVINGGELFDRIIELQRYTEVEAASTIKQALLAIKHMHDNNIVHRDLKPENLLLSSNSPEATIKIADFGFATRQDHDNHLVELVGTPPYMAPELVSLRERYLGQKGYGRPVDVWALGIVLYILLSGIHPFQQDDEEDMLDDIELGEWDWLGRNWHRVSDEARELIKGMMDADPDKRFTIDQCLEHTWIAKKDENPEEQEDLVEVQAVVKEFQAKKKLKGAIQAVLATQKMKNKLSLLAKMKQGSD
eukprot:TRINITY_DN11538_c0_g1_i1.p1 TRINITY_DN11538_c0_g1~~TRINITY_DN11538_c0_g1_i1.p1  ORF type:complete len:334 (-),score=95.95 TRINITY_DN11538_c0_g1_i1:53-1054(-)